MSQNINQMGRIVNQQILKNILRHGGVIAGTHARPKNKCMYNMWVVATDNFDGHFNKAQNGYLSLYIVLFIMIYYLYFIFTITDYIIYLFIS